MEDTINGVTRIGGNNAMIFQLSRMTAKSTCQKFNQPRFNNAGSGLTPLPCKIVATAYFRL